MLYHYQKWTMNVRKKKKKKLYSGTMKNQYDGQWIVHHLAMEIWDRIRKTTESYHIYNSTMKNGFLPIYSFWYSV